MSVDWSRVHFWWGDERWVPARDAERNDEQSREALLDDLDLPESNVHPFPTSDSGLTLDEAAVDYAAELADHGVDGLAAPDLRHHVPRRRSRRAHRVAVPAPVGNPGHRPHRDRRARFAEAAARAAQPHASGHQRVAAHLAGAGRGRQGLGARTRPRRSESRRSAGRRHQGPSPHGVLRRSATRQPRCPSRSSRATTDRAERQTRMRGTATGRPPHASFVARQSFGSCPRRVRSCVSASSSSAAASSSVRRSFT